MQNKLYLFLTLAGSIAITSCSKMGALSSDNFSVNPSPLEAVGGKVSATINGRFPEKYMKKKAIVTVTPEIRYAGGATSTTGATFQGEKVEDNNQSISYRVGGNYTMKANFTYIPEMLQSELYLTFNAKVGKKTVSIPAVKVANGVLSTSELLKRTLASASPAIAPDAYEHIIKQKQDANIKFLIQQANIRTSELKTTSIKDFIKTLKDINADQERKALANIEVSAYASPDGGMKLNEKLAAQREKTSAKYVAQQLKKEKMETDVDTKYTAEDWDGFQELVSQSNIQDKDVIIRVLSMYKDPEEREKQIRNISAAYRELANEILPQLRRARLSINYELIGRSDDEIQAQIKSDASKLSVEEMLYAATLTENVNEQAEIYKKTAELYPSDYRAFNNLASISYAKGNTTDAERYLDKATSLKSNAAEANVNKALLSLTKGKVSEAEAFLSKGSGTNATAEALGNLYIAQGNYAQASSTMNGVKSNSAALAQILNKDYNSAEQTLSSVASADATTSYLKAIVAARTGNKTAAISNLKDAISKDSSYAAYAAKDLEFSAISGDENFKALIK